MALTLYALDGCPYCETVSDALDEHGLDYETGGSRRCTPSGTTSSA